MHFDTTENLFIEGDNLEVLKLLQKSYYGKVKLIYIDPPYNTGNEFIYPDNFSESLETYLEYAGLIDGEGKKFSTNTANEGRFHTKWLNMMYPRLYLARNLLRDDGVILISIDDREVSNLRKLCDEIFGEERLVSQLVWKNKYNAGALTKGFSSVHEYVLCYSKGEISNLTVPLGDTEIAGYKGRDSKFDSRGGFVTQPLATSSKDPRPNLRYPIVVDGREIWPEKQWIWSKERVEQAIANDEVVINESSGKISVRVKQYLKDERGEMREMKPLSILIGPYNQEGTKETAEIFGNSNIFSFPKPMELARHWVSLTINDQKDKESIILDFFAGSSTTAHAVLDLNQKDNGNRKFIMVQLPEPCPEESEAFKAGYKTIADIGKKRIRLVIEKLESEQNGKLPFDGIPPQDRGFKVLKLDKSNFKQWQSLPPDTPPEKIVEQLQLFVNHVDPKVSGPDDLLFEILIKAGFPPSEPIENLTLAGKTVYAIAGGGLLLCLEDEISAELINAVAEAEPMQFICLDAAFGGNDQLKANAVQTFAARNLGKEKHNQIVFKTV